MATKQSEDPNKLSTPLGLHLVCTVYCLCWCVAKFTYVMYGASMCALSGIRYQVSHHLLPGEPLVIGYFYFCGTQFFMMLYTQYVLYVHFIIPYIHL